MRFQMRFDGLEINRTRGLIVRAGVFVGVLSFFHSFDLTGLVFWFGLGIGIGMGRDTTL
jgi:hypothetical protein